VKTTESVGQRSPQIGIETTEALQAEICGVTAVDKALSLLTQFGNAETVGVSELARRAGLSKSTAFRLLTILHRNGFIERRGSGYRLGSGIYDLGNRVYEWQPGQLRDAAMPYIADLYAWCHETIQLAVLDDVSVLCLEKLYGHHRVPSPSRVGTRIPAYRTALGKVLLSQDFAAVERTIAGGPPPGTAATVPDDQRLRAELARVRRAGVAYDNEELAAGLVCVAVPIVDRRGRAVCSLSVSGAKGHFDPERYTHRLRATAFDVSNAVRRAL
jgi:DNA-binding IclR family transcriptional regulator